MAIAEDELDRFLQQRIPRPLSPGIRARCLPRAPIVFAGVLVALSVVTALVILVRTFPSGFLDDLRLEFGDTAIATGNVLRSSPTPTVVVHPDDPSRSLAVHRVDFRFATSDGEPREGFSHTRIEPPEPGAKLDVVYLLGDPTLARAQGMTIAREARDGLLAVLLPIPPLILLLLLRWRQARMRHLLTLGVNTCARIVDVVESKSVLGFPRLCVALTFRDGRSTVILVRPDRPHSKAIQAHAAASRPIPVLREIHRPAHLLLVDRLRADPSLPLAFEEGMDEYGRAIQPTFKPASART